jgi:hypothetical protein
LIDSLKRHKKLLVKAAILTHNAKTTVKAKAPAAHLALAKALAVLAVKAAAAPTVPATT